MGSSASRGALHTRSFLLASTRRLVADARSLTLVTQLTNLGVQVAAHEELGDVEGRRPVVHVPRLAAHRVRGRRVRSLSLSSPPLHTARTLLSELTPSSILPAATPLITKVLLEPGFSSSRTTARRGALESCLLPLCIALQWTWLPLSVTESGCSVRASRRPGRVDPTRRGLARSCRQDNEVERMSLQASCRGYSLSRLSFMPSMISLEHKALLSRSRSSRSDLYLSLSGLSLSGALL